MGKIFISECGVMGKEIINIRCIEGNWLEELCFKKLTWKKIKGDNGNLKELLGLGNVFLDRKKLRMFVSRREIEIED